MILYQESIVALRLLITLTMVLPVWNMCIIASVGHVHCCRCGTCASLQKCKVSIRFSPTLSDEDIRREAVKLVVADLEWKAAEEQQRVAEQEREGAVVEVQVL